MGPGLHVTGHSTRKRVSFRGNFVSFSPSSTPQGLGNKDARFAVLSPVPFWDTTEVTRGSPWQLAAAALSLSSPRARAF